MEILETIEYKGYSIDIYPDENPESPREWSNLGIMVYGHNSYKLGEEKIQGDLDGWGEEEEYLKKEKNAVVILPLYLYDHSGITMRTYPFSCNWDSGQVGFIYTTRKKIDEFLGVKKLTKKAIEKIKEQLINEVKEFDDYITGNIYGYIIEKTDDSCWGFYGDFEKSGLLETAKDNIDYYIKMENIKKTKKAKAFIINQVPLDKRAF